MTNQIQPMNAQIAIREPVTIQQSHESLYDIKNEMKTILAHAHAIKHRSYSVDHAREIVANTCAAGFRFAYDLAIDRIVAVVRGAIYGTRQEGCKNPSIEQEEKGGIA